MTHRPPLPPNQLDALWQRCKLAGIERRSFLHLAAKGGAAAILIACSAKEAGAIDIGTPVDRKEQEQDLDHIMGELAIEFGRHTDLPLTDAAYAHLGRLFDRTVRYAIENEGETWEEPQRSFIIRRVHRLARRCEFHAEDGVIEEEDVEEAADEVIRTASEACSRAMELREGYGPYCVEVMKRPNP